jgi:large subunit ribosomal protein L7/L12
MNLLVSNAPKLESDFTALCTQREQVMNFEKLEERLRSLLAEGRKIEAIKVYREATGAGLAEAKDAVEALEAGQKLPSSAVFDQESEKDIVALLEQGQKIEAIRIYREKTGAGLKEAKDAVEALAAKHGLPAGRSGCAGVVLLCLAGLGALIIPGLPVTTGSESARPRTAGTAVLLPRDR